MTHVREEVNFDSTSTLHTLNCDKIDSVVLAKLESRSSTYCFVASSVHTFTSTFPETFGQYLVRKSPKIGDFQIDVEGETLKFQIGKLIKDFAPRFQTMF